VKAVTAIAPRILDFMASPSRDRCRDRIEKRGSGDKHFCLPPPEGGSKRRLKVT
jgi:hypothetical protein